MAEDILSGGSDVYSSVSSGQELGYAQITATITTTSTTAVDATGLTTTVTTGVRPIMIEAFCAWLTHSVDQKTPVFTIMEDGVQVSDFLTGASGASTGTGAVVIARRNPTAGSHTYKAQFYAVGAGTVSLFADPTFPAFIQVREV